MTAENNGLKAENAELRKERDFYCNQVIENGGRAQRAIDALNDENAKLRELVPELCEQNAALFRENAKLLELMRIMHSELVSCEDNGYVCGGHKFDDRMRELGIEIPKEYK